MILKIVMAVFRRNDIFFGTLCRYIVSVSVYVIFQIDDGRDGGNVGFGDDDRGQYENECQHALTRIKMNYYRWAVIGRDNIRHCPLIGHRAEDEMLILERLRWRREVDSRRRQWKTKEKELAKLRVQVSRWAAIRQQTKLPLYLCLCADRKIKNGGERESHKWMRRKRRMAPYRVEMKIWREQSGIKSWKMFPLRARESKLGDTSWSVPCAGRGWWRPSTSARWSSYNYIWQSPPPVCRVSGWSRGLQHLLPAANCETKLCQLFHESVFISAPQECPQCLEPLTGRNILVENISAILFSQNYAGHDKEKLEKEKFQISTHLLFLLFIFIYWQNF